jgi:hypothetical protein
MRKRLKVRIFRAMVELTAVAMVAGMVTRTMLHKV